MKKTKLFGTLLLFFLFLSSAVFAEEKEYSPIDKLGRGVTNMTLGVGELPKQIMQETEESNLFYGMTTGFAVGFGRMFLRTVVGAYEVGTFLFPYPVNYAPIMKPEHVFQSDKGDVEVELEE